MEIRKALKENAKDLAYMINLAGEGIPVYLWKSMIQANETPLDVGALQAEKEEGGFSYTNAKICIENNILIGMAISYRQPDPCTIVDLAKYANVLHPLIKLEDQAPGSWHINAIATYEAYRGKGVASALLGNIEIQANSVDCDFMSLIVASENVKAKRLYENLGFNAVSSLPVIPYPGSLHGGDWILMKKRLKDE